MRSAPSQTAATSSVILLVDDNPDGILARKSVLEEFGYRVLSANSGEEALQRLSEEPVDLLITDYKMKPLNGLELIAALRPSRPTLPVILLTGFADSLGLRPENTGANIVMQKSANELNALLRNAKRLLQPPRKPARSNTSNKASRAHSTSR